MKSKTKQVFEKLVRIHKPHFTDLKGKIIAFDKGGRTKVIAKIISVKDNKPEYQVIPHIFCHQTNFTENAGYIQPVHFARTPSHYIFEDDIIKETFLAHEIFLSLPISIRAEHCTTEFTVFQKDNHLDELLKQYSDSVNSLKSVETLNTRLHNEIKLRNLCEGTYNENNIPIGQVIKTYGASCRHLAALEYFIFLLNGITTRMVATPKNMVQKLGESHCFNEVLIENTWYTVDPSNNWVFPSRDIKKYLCALNKPTEYHLDAEPLEFSFIN